MINSIEVTVIRYSPDGYTGFLLTRRFREVEEQCLINVEHITVVEYTPDNLLRIHLMDGSCLQIKETYEYIKRILGGEKYENKKDQ